ncbi:MAG: hypothetical protein IJ093_02275 [Bacilli bacterium]|nr:hypothetical protein [Bacilli bacterium]
MKQSIGEWATLNIIIIFIVIVFGLLTATISYYKAFKTNSLILDSIDQFEGYNRYSKLDIENKLKTIGYAYKNNNVCPTTRRVGTQNVDLVSSSNGNVSMDDVSHYYCVYYYPTDGASHDEKGTATYYNYSVVTYIFVELPIVGSFKIPVHTKGERIYNFSSNDKGSGS